MNVCELGLSFVMKQLMRLSLKKWAWALLVLPLTGFLLQACAPKHQSEDDCGFVQNVYGERISWKTNDTIPLYLHESFPDAMIPALQEAIDSWSNVMGHAAFQLVTGYRVPGAAIPKQDGMNVIYWMTSWEADKSSEQARTSIYWVEDQIHEADMRINAKNFTFYLDSPISGKDVHLESLLIHELGHVLGLKHKDSDGSVMATYLSSKTVRDHIGDADTADIRCEY